LEVDEVHPIMKTTALSLVLVAGLAAGCSNKTSVEPAASAAAPAAAAQAGSDAPAAVAAGVAGGPQSFSGTVLETMDAASYTYVRVKTNAGDMWAASGQFPVAVGDRVTVPIETPMQDFHSESLNRDFPIIYFASRITREGDATPAASSAMPALAASHGGGAPAAGGGAMGGMMGGMMGGQGSKPAPVVQKMPPPEGGMSVADVWAKRASLAGKTVIVRGTVVKFNGGIMGRNWVHIQDGSGKAEDGTHDLTVTCDVAVKPGDVITATGVLAVDKDFTAGYVYPAIIEGAKIVVQ
jgi:hypothetical protein